MLKVYKECCKNCLLSSDAIVSPKRRKEIIQGCVRDQTYFVCHKSTMRGEEVVCKSYFDKLGQHSQMVRIAERLNAIEYIEQPEAERLRSYTEQNTVNTPPHIPPLGEGE